MPAPWALARDRTWPDPGCPWALVLPLGRLVHEAALPDAFTLIPVWELGSYGTVVWTFAAVPTVVTPRLPRTEPTPACTDETDLIARIIKAFDVAIALRVSVNIANSPLPRFEMKAKRWVRSGT